MPLADILGTLPEEIRNLVQLLSLEIGFENVSVKTTCNKDEQGFVYHFHIWGRYIMKARPFYNHNNSPIVYLLIYRLRLLFYPLARPYGL